MGMPQSPVTLTPEQVAELNSKLGDMRHNINNNLSLIIAAIELSRRKPDAIGRMLDSLEKQPDRIMAEMRAFTTDFEKSFGITRDEEPMVGEAESGPSPQ